MWVHQSQMGFIWVIMKKNKWRILISIIQVYSAFYSKQHWKWKLFLANRLLEPPAVYVCHWQRPGVPSQYLCSNLDVAVGRTGLSASLTNSEGDVLGGKTVSHEPSDFLVCLRLPQSECTAWSVLGLNDPCECDKRHSGLPSVLVFYSSKAFVVGMALMTCFFFFHRNIANAQA